MGDVLGEDLRGRPYAMRLKRLKARAVGLWDVIESADREGSLDSAIRGAELRDLSAFVDRLPALEAVAFNGKRTEEHTTELPSLMRNSYAVFCWKKRNNNNENKGEKNTKIK